MAEDGQLAGLPAQGSGEPTLADLLDPIALEARLKEARVRRAEALARRSAPEAPPAAADVPAPPPPAAPPIRSPKATNPRVSSPVALGPAVSSVPPRPTRSRGRSGLMFVAGLGLGGAAAAVTALALLPSRLPAPAPAPTAPEVVALAPAAPAEAPDPAAAQPWAPAFAAAPSPDGPAGLAEPARERAPAVASGAPALPEPAQAAAAARPSPPAPAVEEAAAPPLPSRVFIHYPRSAEAAAAELRTTIEAAGVGQVEVIPVGYAISRSNIRYYHDADAAAAGALSGLVAPALPSETAPGARDFTDYATPTAPGSVELWLAGTPPADEGAPAVASPADPPETAPLQAAQELPAPAGAASGLTQAELVERALARSALPPPGQAPAPPSQIEAVERILLERLGRLP
jgi:hypothetical protein